MPTHYREEPCLSALNKVEGMPFRWSLNPYMGCAHRCAFCYVRGFERRADRAWGDDYGVSIRVKSNIVEVLRAELARPSWRRESVAIGAATDPYQPAEGRYRLTRGCIEALGEARTPFGIVTRGPLVVRDIDVLQEASRRASVGVYLSVPTLDPAVWTKTEPGAPPPRQRLRALEALIKAGVRAGVALAPILPGISDRPDQLAEVVRAARAAGATRVWAEVVYLRPGTREHFLELLDREWPEERARYEALFNGRIHMDRSLARPAIAAVGELVDACGIADRRPVRIEPEPQPRQLPLAI